MSDLPATALRVENLEVRFGQQAVFSDVSFEVEAHTTLVLTGPSGCGKTTLLRAIAGLVSADHGHVTLGAARVDELAANRRGIVYLNQEPLLFPHLTLFENLAFGLRLRRFPLTAIRERVGSLLRSLGLDDMELRRPHTLSGGERQRAAFGRALAVEPALLLLDEPFSNLDPDTRASMQGLFKQVSQERGVTSLFVTHDLKESLCIGDRFGLMRNGHVDIFGSKDAYAADPRSGVAREAQFWQDIIPEAVDENPAKLRLS